MLVENTYPGFEFYFPFVYGLCVCVYTGNIVFS